MRTIRRFMQLVLTSVGAGIVLYAVFQVDTRYERLLVVVLGLFIMELGIWQVTRSFFPNEREYRPLRHETEFFLKLVRRLNRAAMALERGSPNAAEELDRIEGEMHHSVERMRRLAGRTLEEMGTQPELVAAEAARN